MSVITTLFVTQSFHYPGLVGAFYSQTVRLIERHSELNALSRALDRALGGTGVGLAICGEPGAGKSALVEVACAQATGLRMLRGACDPLATPRPLGPFRDLLADLGSLDRDASLAEVCEATYDALRSEPTVLVVEDLHWVDAASVEVLRFLVRRLETMACAIVVTYRDDEITAQHSARPLLGDFAAVEHLSTLRLAPLSVAGVAELLADTALEPEAVYAVTGGNPFFVAEVAKEPDRPLPSTVRDTVLARTAGIAAADFEVLQIAAAAPDRLDDRLLPALGRRPAHLVAAARDWAAAAGSARSGLPPRTGPARRGEHHPRGRGGAAARPVARRAGAD